jgi:uncharacterized phage protein (TIGR01671 family)
MIPKFRAWDKKRKVMYVGVGIFQEASVPRCVFGGGIDPLDAVLLDEVELMMSTGLRDRNGKEIWEGDVVYAHLNKTKYVVEFGVYENNLSEVEGNYCHGFYLKNNNGFKESMGQPTECVAVIGNIHQNPELLTDERRGR